MLEVNNMNVTYNESQTEFSNKISSPYSKYASLKAHFKVELDNARLKLLIIFVILLFSGFSSVISQVYMNDILKMTGYDLKNPVQPTMLSFLTNFLSNASLYVLIIILLGMGTFANELEINKQVYFSLARPVSRSGYFLTRALILTIGTLIVVFTGSAIVYGYSLVFFKALSVDKIILILLLTSLQYSALYSLMVMFSAKFNQTISGVLGLLTFISEAILTLFPPLKWFSPLSLSGDWTKIINNTISTSDLTLDFLALLVWTIVPIIIGWIFYQKRDL